jgi:hypothetical protein
MTNEEVAARQLHNLNNAVFAIAVALRRQMEATLPPPMIGAVATLPPEIEALDKAMQSFADTLQSITSMVHKANNSAGIILPN